MSMSPKENQQIRDAWHRRLEWFRNTYPNLKSYQDDELSSVLQDNGVRFSVSIGLVESQVSARVSLSASDALAKIPPKN